MESWYVTNPPPTFNSGFETDEFNDYVSDGLDEILNETPLGEDIILCKGVYNGETDTFETEINAKGVIQGVTADTQTKAYQRQLLTKLNTISDYKYIKYKGDIWLIMAKPSDNQFYEKCILHQCNYIAKWQNTDGTIIYKPFFVSNASQYNSGEEGTKTITIGYNQLLVYTSLDEDTMYFNREQRMFIDYNIVNPLPYSITRIDTVSFSFRDSRILTLIFTEDQYNPSTDNIELMLCDYFTPTPTPPISDIEITYTGQPQIRSGGSYKTFTADTTDEATWSLNLLSTQTNFVTLTTLDNNKCKIKCLSNESLVGSLFKLIATTNNATSELTIKIGGGL